MCANVLCNQVKRKAVSHNNYYVMSWPETYNNTIIMVSRSQYQFRDHKLKEVNKFIWLGKYFEFKTKNV